jgi:hypothetical protein
MNRALLTFAVLLSIPLHVLAEPAAPFVAYLFPAGGQRGTTVEFTATGQNLTGASDVRVLGEGVSVKIVKVVNATTLTLSATIAADAEPGLRELRFQTPGGSSNRVRFAVGQVPEQREKEPNSEFAVAETLPALPVLINAQLMEGDRDYYKFSAKAGQTIVCEAQARRLMPFTADAVPGWTDVCLTLYDAATGRQIACVDDTNLNPDPVLIFPVTKDGDYVIEAKDILYRGRGDFLYRLSIGELPYVTHVYPLGVRRGSSHRVHVAGVNLPSPWLDVTPAALDASTTLGVLNKGFASNRVPLAIGDLPELTEAEPNDRSPSATAVSIPATVSGRIDHRNDVDHFTFTARRGERLAIDLRARRLASPLDAHLAVSDAAGKLLAENDDTVDPAEPLVMHHADPRLIFTVPNDGKFIVAVRDVQNKGGEAFAYRLTIAAAKPDYQLRVTPDNPRICRGDSTLLTVHALRLDGFAGPVDVNVAGLPPGYSASTATISPHQTQAHLTITAPADAPLTVFSPRVIGTATSDGATLTRTATGAEQLMQAFSITHVVPTDDFALTVLEGGGGFSFAPPTETRAPIEVTQGGEAKVRVVVRRGPAAAAQRIVIRPAVPVRGVNVRGGFIAVDATEAAVTIVVTRQATPGPLDLVLVGTAGSGAQSVTRTLPAIPLRVLAPPPTTRKAAAR